MQKHSHTRAWTDMYDQVTKDGGIHNGEAVLKLNLGKLITTGMMFITK